MNRRYWRLGEPWVWLTGAALAVTLLVAFTLMGVVLTNGLGVFWPKELVELRLDDDSRLLGEIVRREPVHHGEGERLQLRIGNRDLYGLDFRWVDEARIAAQTRPEAALALERLEYGHFHGYLVSLTPGDFPAPADADGVAALRALHAQVEKRKAAGRATMEAIAQLNRATEQVKRQLLRLDYRKTAVDHPERLALLDEKEELTRRFQSLVDEQERFTASLRSAQARFRDAGGREKTLVVADLVRILQPNTLTTFDKALIYADRLLELLVGEPRESNTEGGLFPAIFGTVLLIFVMSLFSFPLGVIAAIYLREYARDGALVRLVRIAVNNLAGIPSIVYGIFGLGFFIYGIGSSIDQFFFPEYLPTPTFGTGGLLWASLTLALLTVPVVIVATEEALGAIPREMREGSYSLGATKFQTLVRILLPMASPGIMTGLILAMARAAGEVAPLMITGVVKLAPSLPLDGTFPFLHLDRKFMHLGFHIFDIGFQSPNVEAAKPMIFVTTLLLVLIVLVMSSVAIWLRNKMKKRYTFGTF